MQGRVAWKTLLSVVAAAYLSAGALRAADSPVLPANLEGWQRATLEQVDARELETVTTAEAAVLREYGALGAERAGYQRGSSRFLVTVFRMQDRTGAYGAQRSEERRVGKECRL